MADVLRFMTCGSVDDGKSTLIGHLLYDAKMLFADQEQALEPTGGDIAGERDYSLLMDGLSAEREQGITIDVAYRYFATENRSFIVADTPGHEEYTRNMAVAASQSDLGLLLIDGTRGVRTQTRRHLMICDMMGIRNYVFAVNKMDLMGYSEDVFRSIEKDLEVILDKMSYNSVEIIPVSALAGDNVTETSDNMKWYEGMPLLEYLECVEVEQGTEEGFVMPVQRVVRTAAGSGGSSEAAGSGGSSEAAGSGGSYKAGISRDAGRGLQGNIAAGRVCVGDEVTVYPGGSVATISAINAAGIKSLDPNGESSSNTVGESSSNTVEKASTGLAVTEASTGLAVTEASRDMAVTIKLAGELDISRGHVLVKDTELKCTDMFEAKILWMNDRPLTEGRNYALKLATQNVNVSILKIKHGIDPDSGAHIALRRVEKNGIARVDVVCHGELVFDSFGRHQAMGRFILIDKVTGATAGCGTIMHHLRRAENVRRQNQDVARRDRADLLGQRPGTIWFTGLSGSGKSAVANELEKLLVEKGMHTMLLDGDNLRLGINRDLGFNDYDRRENIRRVAEIARLMNDAGIIVITALVSPFEEDREMARKIVGEDYFSEVYVSTPIAECEKRDEKGLYKKAREGEIPNFTGVGSPYEVPEAPDLVIDTTGKQAVDMALKVYEALEDRFKLS